MLLSCFLWDNPSTMIIIVESFTGSLESLIKKFRLFFEPFQRTRVFLTTPILFSLFTNHQRSAVEVKFRSLTKSFLNCSTLW
ncbi:hypothetical protein L6452_30292 [Arctium lappa]|uniref:Uncharacterized protein n=1 Tax=Arctium lappa TaxID=4217 RepID=A0ACB8ZJ96_ARCLA|nr:hypothetical protein L6452_30292 [Arctium lappa]